MVLAAVLAAEATWWVARHIGGNTGYALGPIVVEAAGITAGQRVHDVAAGSGNVAIPAARTGAEVVATDLTPELLEKGRHDAEAEGQTITWRVADAEALPFDDASFDVASISFGIRNVNDPGKGIA